MKKKEKKSMSRKTSELPTRVFAYGVLSGAWLRDLFDSFVPLDDAVVRDQIHRAHIYRKRRVEIECERRRAYREIRSRLSPVLGRLESDYAEAQEAYEAARKRLCDVPKSERDEHPMVKEVRSLAAGASMIWESVRRERKAVEAKYFAKADAEFGRRKKLRSGAVKKKRASEGLSAVVGPHVLGAHTREIREDMLADARWSKAWKDKVATDIAAETAVKEARDACGCYTGVYQVVDKAAIASFKDSRFDPEVPRFDGTGLVGCQVMGRVTADDALSGRSPIVQIEVRKQPCGPRGEKSTGATHQIAVAKLRLAAGTYLHVPFKVHRPLPDDAAIKWVYLVVKRVGLRYVREIQFTVESAEFARQRRGRGVLAVHVGWRVGEGGVVRSAVTWDGRESTSVVLPAVLRDVDENADRLKGYADDHFNDARGVFVAWCADHADEARGALSVWSAAHGREWRDEWLDSAAQWRAHAKLARVAFAFRERYLVDVDVHALWRTWRKERLRRREDLFGTCEVLSAWFRARGHRGPRVLALYLEWWRRKDEHLINMARGSAHRRVLHRREIYRVQAADWSSRYATVVVDKWNKQKTARNPKPENDTRAPQEERAGTVRQLTAAGGLVEVLKGAFGKDDVVEVAQVPSEHFSCGGSPETSAVEAATVRCGKCGRSYDQDVNRARWLWAMGREQSGGEGVSQERSRRKRLA